MDPSLCGPPVVSSTKQRFLKSTLMPFSRELRNLSICGLKRYVQVFDLFDCRNPLSRANQLISPSYNLFLLFKEQMNGNKVFCEYAS